MAYTKKKVTKKSTTKKAYYYEIDGFKYKSKTLLEYHTILKTNKYVKSFHLPEVAEDKEARCAKYNSYKVIVNDIQFDSIMESRFYLRLLEMKAEGQIKNFEMQHTYELQPGFRDKISKKAIRAITYIADFVVVQNDNSVIAVDVKGEETPVFKIKKKMFQYKYPDIRFMCMRWVNKENDWFELSQLKGK